MKIGLACRHFLSTKGGLERYTLAVSTELVRRGHEVHVFAHSGEKKPGIQMHPVPIIPLTSPGKNLSFAYMAAKRMAAFPLDVVHSMERLWDQDIFRASDGINPVQMAQRYPNPFIRGFKTITPRRQALAYLERKIFCRNGARFVMTNSKLVKEQICRHYAVPGEKIHVIYNSVDQQRYNDSLKERFRKEVRNRYGVTDQETLLLFVGNGFQLKGLPVILEALAGMNNRPIKLLVAGKDPVAPYRQWAEQNGLGDTVIFLGYQTGLESFYGAADLFVLPTQYDPFANVCLEAMACGTPVITTRMNGVAEIIHDGFDGYVLNSRDPQELASRLRDFIAIADKKVIMSRVTEKAATFTMDAHMRQLIGLYDLVCEEKKEMTISGETIEIEERPHMIVNRDFAPILEDSGLLDFDRLYHFQNGIAVKQIRDRGVLRMEIRTGNENRIFYLKRHVACRVRFWDVISSLFWGKSPSPGRAEFENILDFREKGIPTVVPVAAGERRIGFCRYESFLLTESFDPYVSFEEIIYKHPEKLRGTAGVRRKAMLIKAIARLARQMHDAGFNHRDFNATHVLVGPEDENGNSPLGLFDFQRMDRKKWLRLKWFIKIMAELSYTMPEPLFDNQDRLLLFRTYKGFSRMGIFERLQLKWISMKMKKIGKHTKKIMEKRK